MALMLAACSTGTGGDEAFSGGPGKSYVLVVASDGMPMHVGGDIFMFRRVDLASTTFLRETVTVWFNENPLLPGHEFRKPQTMAATPARFGGENIAPGDYTLISHIVGTREGAAAVSRVNCYSLGAPVYRFREGAINIVPRGEAAAAQGDETLQAQVAEVMTRYRQMTAPRVLAQQLGTASFATGSGDQDCKPTGTFAFTASSAEPPR
jgi:hypothetical protein